MKSLLRFSLLPLLLHALASHAAITVTNIAEGCDAEHSLFLKSDGSLWAMGCNNGGALGDGTYNSTNRAEQIVAGGVTTIAAAGDQSRDQSLFLKSDGSLWVMGYNANGQLGDGTFSTTNRPEQIVPSGVTAIAGGGYHSLFLKSDGSLWAMGDNSEGQLGDGSFNTTNRPEQIVPSGVTAIAAGKRHSLFLQSGGSLWAMGWDYAGQLGDGGFGANQPEEIITNGVAAIAAGYAHSLFLKSDGSLWAMGDNGDGQLGDGSFNRAYQPEEIITNGVTAIAAGSFHSLFLKSDGSLWAMGRNLYGQLGDGTFSSTNWPEKIVASGVTAIAAADRHSLFLKSDGSLWAMGYNYYGQLGDGSVDALSPYGTPTPEQIFPAPPPVLLNHLSSQTNLQFTATCGFGAIFYLLGSTNLSLPLSQWTPIWTNAVTARGTNNFSATITNPATPGGRQYFILQSQ